MNGPERAAPNRFDPDELAALFEQRDFLLRSIEDLEGEHRAGEIDDSDYEALRDDYTSRAAGVLRQIDAGARQRAERRGQRSMGRIVGVIIGVVAFAVLAGWLVARSAGSRGADDELSGAIRQTTRQRLADCLELGGSDLLGAVQCYDEVLGDEPANAQAMAYRGWLLYRTRDPDLAEQGAIWIDRAVQADPSYPDARAFRALVLRDIGRPEDAIAELDALEALDPPPIISDLIEAFDIRARAEAELTTGSGSD